MSVFIVRTTIVTQNKKAPVSRGVLGWNLDSIGMITELSDTISKTPALVSLSKHKLKPSFSVRKLRLTLHTYTWSVDHRVLLLFAVSLMYRVVT